MSISEITELMELNGWSKSRLAAELDLGENIVYRWLQGDRVPGGPATILMKLWLEDARKKRKKQKQPA